MDYIPMEMIQYPPFLLNWGAKWETDKQVRSGLLIDHEIADRNDMLIVSELADLIRQADAIVGHNVDNFDLPVLNSRIMYHRLEPLGPIRTVDTLKLSRRNFGLPYHKLDYLGEYLGLGRKIKTDFGLWRDCMEGKYDALQQMKRYNRQDVLLLEDIFHVMKPYVRNLPRLFRADYERELACPSCGSGLLQKRGTYDTQATTMQKWQCQNCQRYSKTPTQIPSKRLAVTPL